jgi:hypothetical protein
MHFTEMQLANLKSAGAKLDATDLQMADRLERKGFVADDFVAAYREYGAMRAKYPELAGFGRDMLETIAFARKLGLTEEEEYWFIWDHHQRGQTLTQAYNRKVPSGRGMATFGGLTAGLGIAVLVVGMALSTDVTYQEGSGEVTSGWGYLGKAMEITGGVAIAAGLATTIIGLYRWTTPLGNDTPDSPSASARNAIRFTLAPSLGPRQAGLGLTAAF